MIKSVLYIGGTLVAKRTLAPAPVPSNIKDPVKIADRQHELLKDAQEKSASVATACSLATVCIFDANRNQLNPETGEAPADHLSAMIAAAINRLESIGTKLVIVGLDAHLLVRVALLESASRFGAHAPPQFPKLREQGMRIGVEGAHIIDPYKLLIAAEERPHVDIAALCAYLGVPFIGAPTAQELALMAYNLSQATNLA